VIKILSASHNITDGHILIRLSHGLSMTIATKTLAGTATSKPEDIGDKIMMWFDHGTKMDVMQYDYEPPANKKRGMKDE